MKLLVALLSLVLSASPVWATDRYVSTASPGATCADALVQGGAITPQEMVTLGCMSSGDTVLFLDGTYTTAINWSSLLPNGTSGNQTTARSLNKWGAVIAQTGTQFLAEVLLNDKDYVTIDGFDVNASSQGDNASSMCFYLEHTSAVQRYGVWILNNHCTGYQSNGMNTNTETGNISYDNLRIENNVFESPGTPTNFSSAPHGIYVRTRNSKILRNTVYSPNSSTSGPSAIQCRHVCMNNEIAYNRMFVYQNAVGLLLGDMVSLATGTGNSFHHNTIKAVTGSTGNAIYFHTRVGSSHAYHNVVDGFTTFIRQRSSAGTGNKASNNICVTGGTCTIADDKAVDDLTLVDNLTGVATSNFVDRANGDYSLVAGAVALIDQGTTLSGQQSNGFPDLGASETLKHSICSVESATPTKLSITFENNVNPPLLPASPAFGTNAFTTRKAGTNNVVTGATRVGDNQIDLTLTNAIVNGNTVDYSYSITSGNVTDSALIGGTVNQRLNAITNQSCNNNVGVASSATLIQDKFKFQYVRGSESAPSGLPYVSAPENTNLFVSPGGSLRLRVSITCTSADCPNLAFFPYYNRNGVGYNNVIPDTFGVDGIGFCGTSPDPDIPMNGTPTTDQLSTSGTFIPGALIRTSNAIPEIIWGAGVPKKTELEYCLAFAATVAPSDTYQIRLRKQDGTVLDGYTNTPLMTIMPAAMGVGGF